MRAVAPVRDLDADGAVLLRSRARPPSVRRPRAAPSRATSGSPARRRAGRTRAVSPRCRAGWRPASSRRLPASSVVPVELGRVGLDDAHVLEVGDDVAQHRARSRGRSRSRSPRRRSRRVRGSTSRARRRSRRRGRRRRRRRGGRSVGRCSDRRRSSGRDRGGARGRRRPAARGSPCGSASPGDLDGQWRVGEVADLEERFGAEEHVVVGRHAADVRDAADAEAVVEVGDGDRRPVERDRAGDR